MAVVALMRKDRMSEILHTVTAALAILACALLFPARSIYGVCFWPYPPTVRCEFLNSDAVFVGTVLSIRTMPPGVKPDPSVPIAFDGLDGWVYKLSVQKMFRGPQGKAITVFTTNDDARALLVVGKKYLLFAYKTGDDSLISEFDSQFEIGNCGNSALASKAGKAIHELQGMKIPKDAEIEGRISTSDMAAPVPGIRVVIRGEGRSFQISTDRGGWFHLGVPPGTYSAKVRHSRHWKIAPFDQSLDNPMHFKARKGRCARVQFIATPR